MTADRLAWWGAALGATGGVGLIVVGLARLGAGRGPVAVLVGVVAVAAATVAVVVAGQIAESPDAVPATVPIGVGVALAAAGLAPWLMAFDVVWAAGISSVLVGAGAAMVGAGWRARQAGA